MFPQVSPHPWMSGWVSHRPRKRYWSLAVGLMLSSGGAMPLAGWAANPRNEPVLWAETMELHPTPSEEEQPALTPPPPPDPTRVLPAPGGADLNETALPRVFPALGSTVLDEQVTLYHAYVAALGVPDILIIGSSRALQGVDPQVLQQALALQGHPNLRVYNFSVNGSTAQVMSFVTRSLLAADMQPRLVIWAEGSRGFNSGRFDRTFASILTSPGYAAVQDGARLSLTHPTPDLAIPSEPMTIGAINRQGFLAVNDQFNPAAYYRSFPRVPGQYDDSYRAFRLEGVQTLSLAAMVQVLQARAIPLVFVNLPLSNDYLDPVRLGYERQFQHFLQTQADQGAMVVVDLLERWRWQSHFFADPSHINRYGAREIARILAEDRRIPWPLDPKPASATSPETEIEDADPLVPNPSLGIPLEDVPPGPAPDSPASPTPLETPLEDTTPAPDTPNPS